VAVRETRAEDQRTRMKPTTPDDVFALLNSCGAAAAVGAAMERGLFWLLAERPRNAPDVAAMLGMPVDQCRPWLELIAELGLLDRVSEDYVTSATARGAILDSHSRDTWSFLAREARERSAAVTDLAFQLRDASATRETQHPLTTDYVERMREDPRRAREFTRMLFEIHLPLAEELAASLPIDGVDRLLDVGGGSGVMSMALLRRFRRLEATVLDIPNVCAAGREIAAENLLQDRITYRAIDFLVDDLPVGFDLILYCDVGEYDDGLLGKFHSCLKPGGLLAIVDKYGAGDGLPHPSRAHWALLDALSGSPLHEPTANDVEGMLIEAGFNQPSRTTLPDVASRWSSGWTQILARA
jgi:SAM-dependent methyltransferase